MRGVVALLSTGSYGSGDALPHPHNMSGITSEAAIIDLNLDITVFFTILTFSYHKALRAGKPPNAGHPAAFAHSARIRYPRIWTIVK